ncbi:hypothetical protein RMSM_00574 [Rhodopirellula maiorica SM1]|uniref:Uncharacterized protein n=1 Tax=Rhodopirellula maiorica SM1 TaxID=1265738 RepID=M5RTI4_9BACT|nr:hypothetical protein RMSM_00574 [Rhodopirellula maiorica SM1]
MLDIYRPDKHEAFQIKGSDQAIDDLCSKFEKKKRQLVVGQS